MPSFPFKSDLNTCFPEIVEICLHGEATVGTWSQLGGAVENKS